MTKDVVIGKIASYVLFGIAVIFFLFASSKLYFYDAEDNGLETLKEGEFNVEKGNEGYRIYSKHNCNEIEVELYYESFFNQGDLLWDPSCSGGLFEFRSSTSGDWNYIGTVTFKSSFGTESNEIKVDFNVTASHEIMITDREPIERGLGFRTVSLAFLGLGGIIWMQTRKSLSGDSSDQFTSENPFQNNLFSSGNQNAIKTLETIKNYASNKNISHTELFSSFDTNKDGFIVHFELMNGLKSLGIDGLSPFDIDALVSLLDLNGDGKINLSELGHELDKSP